MERGPLLDEIGVVMDLHRKSLIRLMGGSLTRSSSAEHQDHLGGIGRVIRLWSGRSV
jgi:hypothetical protein